MHKNLTIREVDKSEADSLSDLAMRSKAHWGYSKDFMAACQKELSGRRGRQMISFYHCCTLYTQSALDLGIITSYFIHNCVEIPCNSPAITRHFALL